MLKKIVVVAVLLASGVRCLAVEGEVFHHVKIHRHRSDQDRRLVGKVGTLTFDDANRKFIFEKPAEDRVDKEIRIEVPYDTVTKAVFETTTHMRGGAAGIAAALIPVAGAVAGPAVAGAHVQCYWFFFRYKNGDEDAQGLLEIPKELSDRVIEKANSAFGPRVVVAKYPEEGEVVQPDQLPDFKSKQSLKVDKKDAPQPVNKPDKATIVVVCPPLAARDSGKGNQFKLHANERVVAVNREGTYSFTYLDPGKYHLVSQAENANGFEMELEAGKTYYFLQDIFQGAFKGRTALSRHSPELVTYLMTGAYFSDWSRK